jgi:2-keto-4-pentenoate hydratase/2-oxohepta-3-ene-1,7-dioic acid hydratase in catechol pathway
MKFIRYKIKSGIRHGLVCDNHALEVEGDIFSKYQVTETKHALCDLKILSPCVPTKIVAIGLNYRSHAEELGMALPEDPMVFMKPPTAVIGPDEEIIYPGMSSQVDYEGELAVVIGKKCRFVTEEDSEKYIAGYTCFNDVTARDLQKKDVQFTRAKGFDTFAPMGPFIETDINPCNVKIETFLNGKKKQSGNTSDLIFPVRTIVSFLSKIMTLCPGDIIATGTPGGIGPMKRGDVVEVRIEGIGNLQNKVADI